MKNVVLVGLGPHAKRIYLNYFKKHDENLALVVDVESKKSDVREYLDKLGFSETALLTIDDKYRDSESLPTRVADALLYECKKYEITYMIISTEPKAHFMYLEFALMNNINVLTDKPISVVRNMTNLSSIKKVKQQYYKLLSLARQSNALCKVMCQRQYHLGYSKVKEILTEVVDKYKAPITNIEIFHSDGAWEMPHDMDKENHPYKYGYGKLFHSGYHFIDLLSDLLKINDSLGDNKKIVKGEVYSKVYTPNDEANIFSVEDYKRLFKDQKLPSYYQENKTLNFDNYGEKDFHGLFSFYNSMNFLITTVSLNLLHNGVSMRDWVETRDFYKNNGRIRHEHINIEVGHLLNIQVHSYQSKEIKDRSECETSVGGLEHFDIYIFSNPLVSDIPFKKIQLSDLYSEEAKKDMLGFNELAREEFLKNFFTNKKCLGDLLDQSLAIELLYACSKELYNHYNNIERVEKIDIRNQYNYRYNAKRLQNYSNLENIDENKEEINFYLKNKDNYTIFELYSYIESKKIYEVFISLDDSRDVAGCLLYKTFKNRYSASLYFRVLKFILDNKPIGYLEKIIEG